MREAEKKKQVLRKTTYQGPVVRYHSVTKTGPDGRKEAHNFVTFTDPEELATLFTASAGSKFKPPRRKQGKRYLRRKEEEEDDDEEDEEEEEEEEEKEEEKE